MKVKKFQAKTLPEAVAMMKAEFGNEAIILHTKKIRKRRWFWLFGTPMFEVMGGVDHHPESETRDRKNEIKPEKNKRLKLSDENSELTHTVQGLYQLLAKQDVPHAVAMDLVKSALQQLPKEEWNNRLLLKEKLCAIIGKIISVDPPWEFDSSLKVVALIGPTGVGKTTTIAKLAANYHLIGQKKVGLITLDTYRIAAVEQLKTYADIINIPLKVVYSAQELVDALKTYQDLDLVLIDTAGSSHNNIDQMKDLEATLGSIAAHKYLVISATTKSSDLVAIVDRFKVVGFESLIITKLDETDSFGVILQAANHGKVPIAYLTNGQSVPDDIEVAMLDKIYKLILGD